MISVLMMCLGSLLIACLPTYWAPLFLRNSLTETSSKEMRENKGAASSPFLAFVLITLALAIVSFYTSISGLVKARKCFHLKCGHWE